MVRKRTSEQIRDDAVAEMPESFMEKYDKGQAEHGGNLDENVTWKDIEDEVKDLWFYTKSMRYKVEKEVDSLTIVIRGLQSRVFELKEENHRLKVANEAAEKEVKKWEERSKR
jgi:DNA/RNA-binding domain of Phe-tRNA-synthetase-like protein